jgi:dTDP-4-dehydrorhamnose reductase
MRILLLGKNGQLGQALEQEANISGVEIISYGREELDITSPDAVRAKVAEISPDVLINTAAYHIVPDCELYPEQAFAVNTVAVKQLAELCHEKNIQFVTFSTDFVFDGEKHEPYEESDTPGPLQMYGISKLAGEYAALSYHTNALVIRSAYIYGGKEGSRSKKGNFVLNILKQAEEKDQLAVTATTTVNPTYAVDLAKGTLTLLEKNPEHGIYHLVNEGSVTLADFAEEIIKLSGKQAHIEHTQSTNIQGSLQRPLYSVLANTKATSLGITLPSWQDALQRYISYLSA